MSFNDPFPSVPATVSHLRGIKADLLGAIREERAALEEQLMVMRQDLFSILARLPGGSPQLPPDSDISSRRSHGSLLSDQSGSEEFDDDDDERKSGLSLEGEFGGTAGGPAATCPELAEFQDGDEVDILEKTKVVTCPELEEIDHMRLSIESEVTEPQKAPEGESKPKAVNTKRYGARKLKISTGSKSKQHWAADVQPQKSSSPKTPPQVFASSSSTDPPAVLQDLLHEAQQREMDRRAEEEALRRIEEEPFAARDIESLMLPGQPEPPAPAPSSSSSWLPGQVRAQGSASASSGMCGSVEEVVDRKSQRKQSDHSVTFAEQRGSEASVARVESMPELPELESDEPLFWDSEKLADAEAKAAEPHRRRRRKMHTYPMLVQPSDSEHDENEPLMTEVREVEPSSQASGRPTPADEEAQPLAVVPDASSHSRPSAKKRKEAAKAGEPHSARDKKLSTTSFRDLMPSFSMSWGFTGPASLIGTNSGAASSTDNKWSYLALRRKSKEPGTQTQDLDKLEKKLSQQLFAAQDLIPKAPSPLTTHTHTQKPKISRFALPSQKSRLRGQISNRPRRSFPLDRRSPNSERASEERSENRSTPVPSSIRQKLDPSLFGSEPASMKIRGNIGGARLGVAIDHHPLRLLKQGSSVTGSTTRPPTSIDDSSRGGPLALLGKPSNSGSFWSSAGQTHRSTSLTSSARKRRHTSMEVLRHQQEQEILRAVQEGRHVSFGRIEETIETTHSAPPGLLKAPSRCIIGMTMAKFSARVCGIVPWSSKCKRASIAYQAVVVLVISVNVIQPTIQVFSALVKSQNKPLFMQGTWPSHQSFLSTCLDMTSALGALMGLLSCGVLRSTGALADAAKVLNNYTQRNELQTIWGKHSKRDQLASYLIFAGLVLCRLWVGYHEETMFGCLWQTATFTTTAMVTMGLVGYILHVCRGLVAVVDTYCENVVDHPDFGTAVREWGLVQAMLRSTSAALQSCFVVLLTVATVVVFVTLVDFSNHRSISGPLIPSLSLALAILRISVWAAEVTDKCQRVPLLVNSLSIGTDLDVNRMYTVDYIVHCQAGFYIFEMRLTCSTLMKAIYIACAVTVGVSTQINQV